MAAKGKRTHTILDNTIGDNKIVKILYGHGADYIVWPNTHIIVHGEESYADVTKAIMRSINEDKVVNIPGGEYKSDHDRLNFLRKYIDEEENKAVGLMSNIAAKTSTNDTMPGWHIHDIKFCFNDLCDII